MTEPDRDEIDRMPGLAVIEFGASWCPHCQSIRESMETLLRLHPEVQYIGIEDGKGRRLGRSYAVKLWPTLLFLRDGQIMRRLVRPTASELRDAFALIAAGIPLLPKRGPAQLESGTQRD